MREERKEGRGGQALLVVDVQRDFCPGGALAVPAGDEVVAPLNRYLSLFAGRGLPVFLSRDWHPERTRHFRELGGPWPPHCVQGTPGAELHPALAVPDGATLVSKGTSPEDDGYSAMEGRDSSGTPLPDALRARGVTTLYVGGLATDYCVRASVLDALRQGFRVVLLADAVRGLDVQAGDVARATDEMRRAGTRVESFPDVAREIASPAAMRTAGPR